MFNSVALDVVIGLVFIYLLYSLLATVLQEFISTFCGLRARVLSKAIERMLNDGHKHKFRINRSDRFFISQLKKAGNFFADLNDRLRGFFIFHSKKYYTSLADNFYRHPSIKYLAENSWNSKPSYISAQNFSKVLLDLLKGKNFLPGDAVMQVVYQKLFTDFDKNLDAEGRLVLDAEKEIYLENETALHIRSLVIDSNNDGDKFKASLEQWFNETMERASGWYKKKIQQTLLLTGLCIAMAFNVDTLQIAKHLAKDKNAREQLVKLATEHVNANAFDSSQAAQQDSSLRAQLNYDLDKANNVLGLGWKFASGENNYSTCAKIGYVVKETFTHGQRLVGFLLTAFAISLGAPFWFDMLNKLVKMRKSGDKPGGENKNTGSSNSATDKTITAAG